MAESPALDLGYAPGPGSAAFLDLLYAALDDFNPLAIQEHDTGAACRVFFRTAGVRDDAAAALARSFGPQLIAIEPIAVPEEGWARHSQASLRAVRVGRIVVAPPWDLPARARDTGPAIRDAEPGGDIVIVIDPSMGFGTGHHETTRLCLELLQSLDLHGRTVLDVGTGSGVLAIAASKLGAACVIAADNDPDALENARDNVRCNAAARLELRQAELAELSLPESDIVVANLTAAVLRKHADLLTGLAHPGGHIVVSGFGPDEIAYVTEAFQLPARNTAIEGQWAAADFVRHLPTGF